MLNPEDCYIDRCITFGQLGCNRSFIVCILSVLVQKAMLISRQFVTVIEFYRFLGEAEAVNKLLVIWVVECHKPCIYMWAESW